MRVDQDLPKMDQWICHPHGGYVLDVERKVVSGVLPEFFGYHIVQIGGPSHDHYLSESLIRHKTRIAVEWANDFDGDNVQADLYNLPLYPDSVDVFVLPHVLEYVAEPQKVLSNCYDALVGGGHIVILSFNPYSLFGIAKLLKKNDRVFRRAKFITPFSMRKWLNAVGFEVQSYKSMCFRVPTKNKVWFERLKFLEPIGRFIWPSWGGIYMIMAEKKKVPMNLIKPEVKNGKVPVTSRVAEPSASKVFRMDTLDREG